MFRLEQVYTLEQPFSHASPTAPQDEFPTVILNERKDLAEPRQSLQLGTDPSLGAQDDNTVRASPNDHVFVQCPNSAINGLAPERGEMRDRIKSSFFLLPSFLLFISYYRPNRVCKSALSLIIAWACN